MKQTQEDPWSHAAEAYPVGKLVHGKVMSLTDYGAFVELEPGVEGLIHVSEMSWTKKVKHPSKMLEMAQEVACQVLEVDTANKRISLGMKQLEPDPWSVFTNTYKPGDKIAGKVRSITDYGVFVGIEEGVDGMVHKTDLSWTVKINNPADVYEKGDDVEAIILSINHDEKKVSLGVRQLHDDPWGIILEKYKPGTVVEEVLVLAQTEYGAFVRIIDGIEAIIPSGEMPMGTTLTVGEKVKAEVANIDTMDRRLTMTMLAPGTSDAAEQLQVLKRESSKGATLGDLLKEKLSGINVDKGDA
jgi:small subunit ribosomal protein S1